MSSFPFFTANHLDNIHPIKPSMVGSWFKPLMNCEYSSQSDTNIKAKTPIKMAANKIKTIISKTLSFITITPLTEAIRIFAISNKRLTF